MLRKYVLIQISEKIAHIVLSRIFQTQVLGEHKFNMALGGGGWFLLALQLHPDYHNLC